MKSILVTFEDAEFKKLLEAKKKLESHSWKEMIMELIK